MMVAGHHCEREGRGREGEMVERAGREEDVKK
jgi:hypothetical protein